MRRPLTILFRKTRHAVKGSYPIITALVCLMLLTNSAVQAQGFGLRKNRTAISYRWPAAVYFPANAFAVDVTSQNRVSRRLLRHLKETLEKTIQIVLPGSTLAPASPQTLINLKVIELAAASALEPRTRSEYQAISTRTVTNPETNASETVTDYGYVNIQYTAVVASGLMTVEYGIEDAGSGLVLDKQRLSSNYMQEFQEGYAADLNAVEMELAYQIIREISYRITPRNETVEVVLPKGNLSQTSRLLKSGSWDQAIARLEATPAFKKPKGEAYRLYSLALAREAMAFTTDDLVTVKKRLERAVELYRRATNLYPKEDYFWQSRSRAEWALYLYEFKLLQERKFEECTAGVPGQRCSSLLEEVKRVAKPLPVLTNDKVIEMVRQGLSEDHIIASIKHARLTGFDLSAAGRTSLSRAGVNNRIIREMQRPQTRRTSGSLARTISIIATIVWPFALRVF